MFDNLAYFLFLLLLSLEGVQLEENKKGAYFANSSVPHIWNGIEEVELVEHERRNPFTPYYRDPRYKTKRICKGMKNWQEPILREYGLLKQYFDRNCSHILGNLVIASLGADENISFLDSIEEVSGYVYIHNVSRSSLILPNLRIIRGEMAMEVEGQRFALLVTQSAAILNHIEFPSLVSILNYGVGFFENPGLCFAPFSIDWSDLLEFPDKQVSIVHESMTISHWLVHCHAWQRSENTSRASDSSPEPARKRIQRSSDETKEGDVEQLKHVHEPMIVPLTFSPSTISTENQPFSSKDGNAFNNSTMFTAESLPINDRISHVSKTVFTDETVLLSETEAYPLISTTEITIDMSPLDVISQIPTEPTPELTKIEWRCHASCPWHQGNQFCWGSASNHCQQIRKCQNRVCNGPNRCFRNVSISGQFEKCRQCEKCCHEECLAGCLGSRASDCFACRRYAYKGNCVAACPATKIYDSHSFTWKRNPEGHLSLGRVCVEKCPAGFIQDEDHCVLKCTRPGTRVVGDKCVKCPLNRCPEPCSAKEIQKSMVDFLYRSLLHKMEGCTSWDGSLILNQQSLQGDVFNNLTMEEESVRYEDLTRGLSDLEEITGLLYISTNDLAPWLRNLSFLSKLRTIGGDPPTPSHQLPAMSVVRNAHLEYLGLSSLTAVHRNLIYVMQNPRLCFIDSINWTELVVQSPTPSLRYRREAIATGRQLKHRKYRLMKNLRGKRTSNFVQSAPTLITNGNRPMAECVADNQACDESVCLFAAGCWGGGPQHCRICAFWRISDGQLSRCVKNCSHVPGGYFQVMESTNEPKNDPEENKLEELTSIGQGQLGVCSRCDAECGEEPGACFGPGAHQCNYECAHVQDGPFCRAFCPEGKFAHAITRVCTDCAAVCAPVQRSRDNTLLPVDLASTNNGETCSGPGDWFGYGGCTFCLQVNVEQPPSDSRLAKNNSNRLLRCLRDVNDEQICPTRTFKHFIIAPSMMSPNWSSMNGETNMTMAVVRALQTDSALAHLPEQLHVVLADWVISHHNEFGTRVLRACLPCHEECASDCLGPSPTQCRQCKTARHNGRCVAHCPPDTYILPEKKAEDRVIALEDVKEVEKNRTIVRRVKECLACHPQCASISGCFGTTNQDCHTCRHFTIFANSQLTQKSCVPNCPEGTTFSMEAQSEGSLPLAVCSTISLETVTDIPSDGGNETFPTGNVGETREVGLVNPPFFMSSRLLRNLTGVSMGLFCLIGLLAFIFAILFVYACVSLLLKGIRNPSASKMLIGELDEDQSDWRTRCDRKCHRFWMRAIIVDDEKEIEEIKDEEDKDEATGEPGGIHSPLLSSPTDSIYCHQHVLKSSISIETKVKPNMATLLLIPEYQLQRGCLVGAGAFGSVYRGVWNQTAPSLTTTSPFMNSAKEDTVDSAVLPSISPSSPDDWLLDNVDSYANEEYLLSANEDDEEIKKNQNMALPKMTATTEERKNIFFPTSVLTDISFEQDKEREEVETWVEGDENNMVVAIKVLNDATDSNTCKALLEEARVMATVDHPCCLRLLGLCMTARPQLITSFLPLGCLLSYLHRYSKDPLNSGRDVKQRRLVTPQILLHWAGQIASGMAYLASRGIIHRDLAARNVIVEKPDQVKITDFGLAKCLEDAGSEYKAHGGRMPVKWLALECIKWRLFSSKSDVWSYGVTLWEMFMLGKKRPFEEISARNLLGHLESGRRLCQPPMVNLELYTLMVKCWHANPDIRPEFEDLHQKMVQMEADADHYLVFEFISDCRLWSDSGITSPMGTITTITNSECTEKESEFPSSSLATDDDYMINASTSNVGSSAYLNYVSPLIHNKEENEGPGQQCSFSPSSPSTPQYRLLLPPQFTNTPPLLRPLSPPANIAETYEYSHLMVSGAITSCEMLNAEEEINKSKSTETLTGPINAFEDEDYLEPNEERLLRSISSFIPE